MRLATLCLVTISLSGCTLMQPKQLTSAKPPFPEAVAELTQPCPDLEIIKDDRVAITDLMKSVVNNYTRYYQCSLKNDGWNEWYKTQKEIYDKIK